MVKRWSSGGSESTKHVLSCWTLSPFVLRSNVESLAGYYALQLWYCCCCVPLSNQTRAIYILRSFEICVYSLHFLSLCTEFDLKSPWAGLLLCCWLLNSPDESRVMLPSKVVIPWNFMISLQISLYNYYGWYWRLYLGSLQCAISFSPMKLA